MAVITAIEPQRRGKRLNVFVDGEFALGLDAETVAFQGLKVGKAVAVEDLKAAAAADERKWALDRALRLLAVRARAEQEIRTRLARWETPPEVIDDTLERLRAWGYVNDTAFAEAWVEARGQGKPRGRRLIQQELRAKGVAADTTAAATAGVEDGDAALTAALKRAPALRALAYPDFRNRLAGYLQRRGFGYDVITPAVRAAWQAQHADTLPDDADEHG